MKFFTAAFSHFLQNRTPRRNIFILVRFLLILIVIVTTYSILFHYIMEWEGRQFSWVTGFYWTLTVMSTLGFGDITFESDIGRIFSMVVLLSGVTFLLILLPFTFIEFFYAPWLQAQEAARAPRKLPKETQNHVILTHYDAVSSALINKLEQYNYPYVLVMADMTEALRLHDIGLKVVVGELDNPETYRNIRVDQASLVATTASDTVNTNVAFTVREISEKVPIVAIADIPESVDILELAGCSRVIQLGEMMGQSLARRTIWGDAMTHVIGQFDEFYLAEATAAGTPLVGKTIQEIKLRELVELTVVGIWERGVFEIPQPQTRIKSNTVLILAGTQAQIKKYDELFCIYHVAGAPVIIIGGGRVGCATARALTERQIDYRIVEQSPERVIDSKNYVLGNAADLAVLKKAGIMETSTVIITTHDDDVNIYLTIYCRRLRPDIQIISRATYDRNVPTLHRAGADFVMSYATMGANAIFNLLKQTDILMVTEGLNVFKVKVPQSLTGLSIAQSNIRENTGCTIIAIGGNGSYQVNPAPDTIMQKDFELVLIGNIEAEEKFIKTFVQT